MTRYLVTRQGNNFNVILEGTTRKPRTYTWDASAHRFFPTTADSALWQLARSLQVEWVTGILENVLTVALRMQDNETAKFSTKVEGRRVHVMRELI